MHNLEQLNAIRYDLDGDGVPMGTVTAYRTAFGLGAGEANTCIGGCTGYELMSDLDFNDIDARMAGAQPSRWAEETSTQGWDPIGGHTNHYTAVFEGNGHAVSNLFIDHTRNFVGLFGRVNGGAIRNLGLEGGSVTGGSSSGALVGYIEGGTIAGCYATCTVEGAHNVGGLAGYVRDESSVAACYSTANVSGTNQVGGLFGFLREATVRASYATGTISGTDQIGGLIGQVTVRSRISACYATGTVDGSSNVGSLIGNLGSDATLIASYYDNRSTKKGIGNLGSSDALQSGLSRSTSALQTPMVYDDNMDNTDGSSIYEGWNVDVDAGFAVGVEDATQAGDAEADDPWDFGEVREYPALRVDFDGDGMATVAEFGDQRARVVSFSPSSGSVGDEVKIAGRGFLSDAMSEVSFGGSAFASATFIEGDASDASVADTLSIEVPRDAMSGVLSLRIAGLTALSTSDRFVVVPKITALLPGFASIGTEIKVAGTGFERAAEYDSLSFGGSMYVAASSFIMGTEVDTLVVAVPTDARTGLVMLKVRDGAPVSSAEEFEVVPVIVGFTPATGPEGSTVVITGTGFSDIPSDNVVKFGGVQAAAPTDVSTTSLTVAVPDGAQTGPITVEVGGRMATSSESFMVDNTAVAAPVIASFSPMMGPEGTPVVIMGANFSAVPSENMVSFGGGVEAAVPTGVSTVSLTVIVPAGAQTGVITVEVGGQMATSTDEFMVTVASAPEILSFSPMSGPERSIVVVTGTNFSAVPSENMVSFGGGVAAAVPTNVSTMSLTVVVPVGAQTGAITVEVNGQTATSTESFMVDNDAVAAPVIAGFSPAVGPEGSVVVITGANFSDMVGENVVRFGGVEAATPMNVSPTSLTVIVPVDAQTGAITVEVGGQTATSTGSFTVDNSVAATPAVGGFSPTSGSVGTPVVITGANFSAVPSENMVSFGGGVAASEPTDVSPTSLTVVVPAGAVSGPITVEVNGQTATSLSSFTVTSVPGAPMSLVATTVSATEIGLSWMAPSDDGGSPITGYKLAYHKDGATAFGQEIMGIAADATSYAHTGLDKGTAYHYRLIALNEIGESAPSNEASATTRSSGTGGPGTGSGDEMTFGLFQEGVAPYVYPNPSSGEVRFGGVVLGAPYRYKMYRIDGVLAHSGRFVGGSSVDVSSLSEGYYLLVLQSEEGEVLRTRLCILK